MCVCFVCVFFSFLSHRAPLIEVCESEAELRFVKVLLVAVLTVDHVPERWVGAGAREVPRGGGGEGGGMRGGLGEGG